MFELTDHLIGKLRAAGVRIISPVEGLGERSAILTFDMGKNAEFASYLERRGIYISLRGGLIRVSVNFFNNIEDLDRLIAALADFQKL